MTHLEAQNRIKGCHDRLTLSVSRYGQGWLGQGHWHGGQCKGRVSYGWAAG